MQVRFTAGARQDLLEQAEWLELARQGTAARLRLAVEAALERITHNPQGGAPWLHETRRIHLRGFPISLVYRIAPDRLDVVAVAHQRRLPDYWKNR